jgi:hypothetical protein
VERRKKSVSAQLLLCSCELLTLFCSLRIRFLSCAGLVEKSGIAEYKWVEGTCEMESGAARST